MKQIFQFIINGAIHQKILFIINATKEFIITKENLNEKFKWITLEIYFKHQKNIILKENERLNNNDIKELIEIINDIDAEDKNLYYENNLESNFHSEDNKNFEEKESDEENKNFSLSNSFSGNKIMNFVIIFFIIQMKSFMNQEKIKTFLFQE